MANRHARVPLCRLSLSLCILLAVSTCDAKWWPGSADEPKVEADSKVIQQVVADEPTVDEKVVEASVSSDGKVDVAAECTADASGSSTCTVDSSAKSEPEPKAEKEPLPWGQTHIDWPQLPSVFHNDGDEVVEIHYQTPAGQEDMHFGQIPPHESRNFNTYHGAAWYVTEPGKKRKLQTVYVVDDDDKNDYHFDPRDVREKKKKELAEEEREFRAKYLEENGFPWIAQYPREPPIYHMYKAEKVGDVVTVKSGTQRWHKDGPLPDVSDKEVPDDEKLEFRVETLSLTPKVFAIHDVLSKDECDFMVERAQMPGRLQRSLVTTSAVVSKVRTSSNAWFPVEESPVIENIFNRIADVLQMPRYRLRHNQCAENIQLVYYNTTQEYQKHHDYLDPRTFQESTNVQRGTNRFATILFYLNEVEEGGHTFFPRSDQGKDFKVKLPVGSAVLFYSMLEDGNLDVRSEHGGGPVIKGEKYAANLWVWEPRWI